MRQNESQGHSAVSNVAAVVGAVIGLGVFSYVLSLIAEPLDGPMLVAVWLVGMAWAFLCAHVARLAVRSMSHR